MILINDLRNYTASKNNTSHNRIKKNFFDEVIVLIENNQLTVATLTDKLAALTEAERKQLFFTRRWQTPSVECESAQWVKIIYNALNVPIDDLSLAEIVAPEMSQNNNNYLKQYLYQQWQKNPLLPKNIRILEHELKGYLSLGNRENKSLSLAEAMKKNIDLHGWSALAEMLIALSNAAPLYIPDLICKLYDQYKFATNELVAHLVDIADNNQILATNITAANPHLAAAMVLKTPDIFFSLSSSLQNALLVQFERDGNKAILDHLLMLKGDDVLLKSEHKKLFFQLLTNGDYRRSAINNIAHEANPTFKLYRQAINKKLSENGARLIADDKKDAAIRIIDFYLKLEPGWHKTQFFINLKNAINDGEISTELLQEHLQSTNRSRLFSKWSGQTNSRAAGVMVELYRLVNFDKALTGSEIEKMLTTGALPIVPKPFQAKQQQDFLENNINLFLLHPEQTKFSKLGRGVAKALNYYQSFYRLSQHKVAAKQLNAEAIYQDYLIKKGLEQAIEQQAPIFDPQGHVLVTVELNQEDLNAILTKICGVSVVNGTREMLADYLGSESISIATVCNLDVMQHDVLKDLFKRRLLGEEPSDKLELAVNALSNSAERSSLIALQEEMSMHILLCLRVIEQTTENDFPRLNAQERQSLLVEINNQVLQYFSAVLQRSLTEHNNLDFRKLNQALDGSRISLAPTCRKILVDRLLQQISDTDEQIEFKEEVLANITNKLFASTTATGLDYLRTDATNQTVVRISATDNTAHNKDFGAKNQALRLLARNRYHANAIPAVIPYHNHTQEARVPSIAEIHKPHALVVRDVVKKFKHSHHLLLLKNPGFQGPLVYNLLTSLHSKAYDNTLFENKNKQRLSADRILLGSHLYNIEQLKNGLSNSFVFVQNIPVNQHTYRLNNHAFDDATAEAAIMTDMALMSTFNYYRALFSPSLRQSIAINYEQAHTHYVNFLIHEANSVNYFKKSLPGRNFVDEFQSQKALWSPVAVFSEQDNLLSLVLHALFKMMVNDVHHNKQFGMLIQALSVFVEPLSEAGCKSANERYQGVAARVELLKSIGEGVNNSLEKQAVLDVLNKFIMNKATPEDVQEKLDIAYNQYNLQGSAVIFSEEDQGASSKVNATKHKNHPGEVIEFDTNYAETGYLTNLSQKSSATMQAHKASLVETFRSLFINKSESSHKGFGF